MKVLSRKHSIKVQVSKDDVEAFNRIWPNSTLRATRSYWFEFDLNGDLIDTDCPEQDDGPAATAMGQDCQTYGFGGDCPDWAEDEDESNQSAISYNK